MAQHVGAAAKFLPNGGGKGTPEFLGGGQKWASLISEILGNLSSSKFMCVWYSTLQKTDRKKNVFNYFLIKTQLPIHQEILQEIIQKDAPVSLHVSWMPIPGGCEDARQ